jgi:hypothetical protein
MAEITFKYTTQEYLEDAREIQAVTLIVPDDMSIDEFKQVCARLALAIGYQPITVKKGFGDDYEDTDITYNED